MRAVCRFASGNQGMVVGWIGFALALAWLVLDSSSSYAQEQPSEAEQLAVYDLNLARADPPAYAASVGLGSLLDDVAPRPPLAINLELVQSARFRAREMATHDYFAHQSAVTGDWPNRVARDAGYPLVSDWPDDENFIESIAAGFHSFHSALRALIEDVGFDPPGHRIHLFGLEPFWLDQREIGVGYAFRASSSYGHYFAYHTGKRNHNRPFLTGVVYDDVNGNNRYDLGEGLGGVRIRVRGATNVDVVSQDAGGWAVRVDRGGVHTVEASGGPFEGVASVSVYVGSSNVALDFVSGRSQPQVEFEGVPTGAGTVVRLPGHRSSSCGLAPAAQTVPSPTGHTPWWLWLTLVALALITLRFRRP